MRSEFNQESIPPVIQENKRRIEALAQEAGYQLVQTLEELGLSEQELKQAIWTNKGRKQEGTSYYTASRKDGGKARAITMATSSRDIAADIFSPAFYEGHGGNHDFSVSEFENSLKYSIDGEVVKK